MNDYPQPRPDEQAPIPTEEIFSNAEDSIYNIIEMPEFAKACYEQGLDPTKSINTATYWNLVAGFANKNLPEHESNRSLADNALKLLADTPAFIYAQASLRNQSSTPNERQELRERTSNYNRLLRYVGSNYADVRVSTVSQALQNIANIAKLNEPANDILLRNVVRGARHELAFGQVLSHAGFAYEPAPLELDLKGVDYIVNANNQELFVDAKASLSEIESLGGEESAYAIKSPRRASEKPIVVMFSLFDDSEFGDNFVVSDEIAESRVGTYIETLTLAAERAA